MISNFNYVPGDQPAWRELARCANRLDVPDMYPSSQDGEAVDTAKRFCRGCPVILECMEQAIQSGERHGIWGGMDMRERVGVKRHRTRTTLKQRKAAREAAGRLSDEDTAALDGVA